MRKLLLALSIIFNILAIVGAVYVLTSDGTRNAGYAIIPMVIGLSLLSAHRAYINKK